MQVDPDVLFSGERTPFVVKNGINFYGWNEETARWERLPDLGYRVRPAEHGRTLVGEANFHPEQVERTSATETGPGFRVPVVRVSEPGAREYFGGPPMVLSVSGGPGGVVAWVSVSGEEVQVWVRHPGQPARLLWQDQVVLRRSEWYGRPVQFSPDGSRLAVSFTLPYAVLNALPPEQWKYTGFIAVLDAVTGQELHRIAGRDVLQGSAAWSHDGQWLLGDRHLVEVASGQAHPFPVALPVTERRLELLGWGDPGWVMYAQEPGKTVTVTMFHLETGQKKMIARASAADRDVDVRVWMALMPEGYWTDFHARFGAVMRRSMFGQGRVPRPRPAPAWSPAWEEFRALTHTSLRGQGPEVARAWTVGLKADFARARSVRVDPRTLMPPWRSVFGIVHPDQEKVREAVERAGRRMVRLHEQGTEYPERAELPNDSELHVRWAGVQDSPDARVVAVKVDINEYEPIVLRVALHIMVNELNKSKLRGVRIVPCDHTGTPVPDPAP